MSNQFSIIILSMHTKRQDNRVEGTIDTLPCEIDKQIREAFKNDLQKTYGIFHVLVDPPPLTYGKSATFFKS